MFFKIYEEVRPTKFTFSKERSAKRVCHSFLFGHLKKSMQRRTWLENTQVIVKCPEISAQRVTRFYTIHLEYSILTFLVSLILTKTGLDEIERKKQSRICIEIGNRIELCEFFI